MLIGNNFTKNFNKSDLEKILFITRFIKPICVWDSEYHKNEIPYIQADSVEMDSRKKASAVTKDIIESLLGIIPKNGSKDDSEKNSPDTNSNSNLKINSIKYKN